MTITLHLQYFGRMLSICSKRDVGRPMACNKQFRRVNNRLLFEGARKNRQSCLTLRLSPRKAIVLIMKPTLRKSIPLPTHSFVFRKDAGKNIRTDWHYHPDYELVYIKNSRGVWLVGDYQGPFVSGDVILMGPNLPHSYRHEKRYLTNDTDSPGEVIAILFLKEILGSTFLTLPEATGINGILKLSERGLRLTGKTKEEASKAINSILEKSSGRRLIDLLSVLQLIADNNEYEILASTGFTEQSTGFDNERINAVLEYTFAHYHDQITIEDVAAHIHMSRHSFSRFFKDKTKKTFIQFLTEVRISKACKLLIEEDMHIAAICYSCGYNNVSHFNHQFKAIIGMSPQEYKQMQTKLLTEL